VSGGDKLPAVIFALIAAIVLAIAGVFCWAVVEIVLRFVVHAR